MKVISSQENSLEFDNGLAICGVGENDCCAVNYIDFEQFEVGTEFPTMTAGQLVDAIKIEEDGFSLKDSQGLPKWAQARSNNNGYYSRITELFIEDNGKKISLGELDGEIEY